jgi:ankyrin repeat protein
MRKAFANLTLAIACLLIVACQTKPDIFIVAKFVEAIQKHDREAVRDYIRKYKDIAHYEYNFEQQGNPAYYAAVCGDLEVLKMVVEAGAAVNYHTDKKVTPLMMAMGSDNPEIIRYLLKKGAIPDKKNDKGATAYHWAVSSGTLDMLKMIVEIAPMGIDIVDDTWQTPLFWAIDLNKPSMCTYLVSKGASVKKGLEYDWNYSSSLIASKSNEILIAVLSNNIETLDMVNEHKMTFLHIALYNDNYQIVPYLLPHFPNFDMQDVNGNTPLFIAAEKGDKSVIFAIQKAGGSITIADKKGITPLNVYLSNTKKPDPEVVKLLTP